MQQSTSVKGTRLIAILAVLSLAIGALLDISTGESLAMSDNVPSHLVILLRAMDLYASPITLVMCLLTLLLMGQRSLFLAAMNVTLALAVVTLLNNVAGLIVSIFDPKVKASYLLLAASLVYLENIAVFVAYYWRFDHPFQDRIAAGETVHPAVMFPQNAMATESMKGWRPSFMDYLFLSFNTASTFGPTLPVPLRGSMQIGMMLQVAIAMSVLVMIAARAIGLIQ